MERSVDHAEWANLNRASRVWLPRRQLRTHLLKQTAAWQRNSAILTMRIVVQRAERKKMEEAMWLESVMKMAIKMPIRTRVLTVTTMTITTTTAMIAKSTIATAVMAAIMTVRLTISTVHHQRHGATAVTSPKSRESTWKSKPRDVGAT